MGNMEYIEDDDVIISQASYDYFNLLIDEKEKFQKENAELKQRIKQLESMIKTIMGDEKFNLDKLNIKVKQENAELKEENELLKLTITECEGDISVYMQENAELKKKSFDYFNLLIEENAELKNELKQMQNDLNFYCKQEEN